MSAPQKLTLFQKGWHLIPDVIGSSFMAAIGIGLMAVGCIMYDQKDGNNRRYRYNYTVIRDDDPLAAKVRKD